MPAAKLGRGTFIKIGAESSWGSAGSTGVSNRIISESLMRNQERTQKNHLSTSGGVFAFDTFDGMEICEGSIELPIHYSGNGLLIKHACGAVSAAADGSLFMNTYTPVDELPSLTIDLQRGNNTSEKFLGCIVSSWSLSCEAGGQMIGTFNFIAKTAETRDAAITASFNNANKPVLHHECLTMDFNSVNYNIRSFTFNVDNKIERRDLLGSKLTAQPATTDLREVTMEVTADYESDDLYNAQLAGTISNLDLQFDASTGESFIFTLFDAQIISYNDDISTVGRIERTMTFQGFADIGGAHDAYQIRIKNGDNGGVAN